MYLKLLSSILIILDITPKNVLMKFPEDAANCYAYQEAYGKPSKEILHAAEGGELTHHAPQYIVEDPSLETFDVQKISDDVMLIDFGESFFADDQPQDGVGTPISYLAPEIYFEHKASKASDIWALACTIFEIRSGFQLFSGFLGSYRSVLSDALTYLGLPPEPLFSELSKLNIIQEKHKEYDSRLLESTILSIGKDDHASEHLDRKEIPDFFREGFHEPLGNRISTDEAHALMDLLRRALKYRPEERLTASDMARHSWLTAEW